MRHGTASAPLVTEIWPSATVTPHDPLTDAGAAERFARAYGDDWKFDHRRKGWYLWSGHRWRLDTDGEVTRTGLEFCRSWQREALEIADTSDRQATSKFAIALESRKRLSSVLEFARDLRPIADAGDQWDANQWLLGVPNGVVDLRTGLLRPGRREDRITMSTAVSFDSTATCPRWEQFIGEIFAGASDLTGFIQRALGYSLCGDVSEQVLLFCYGGGANGKSTMANTIRSIVGDYGHALPFSAIQHDARPGAASYELVQLAGRRFVTASETSEGRRLDEGRVKWLTGSDRIRARDLYQSSIEFTPTAKFWLAANHKPIVRDDSHGFWRRIRLVPFTQSFSIDPTLSTTLANEGPGILAWLVDGCLSWQREGLNPPPAVLEATAEYQHDSDTIGAFITEALDVDVTASIGAAELYLHYKAWTERQGLSERERLNATAFGRKASARFDTVVSSRGKSYIGISRRPL